MYYSAIGLIAIAILIIENWDIILNYKSGFTTPAWKIYRRFLFAVGIYYITDILWGIVEHYKLAALLFADTSVYFIAMAAGVLFWTQYAVAYPDDNSASGRFLILAGRIFSAVLTLLVVVNIFTPVLFIVDENCVYQTRTIRHVILITQIVLLSMISVNTFSAVIARRVADATRKRYRTLAFFGLIMAVNLLLQLWFPYLPLYSVAYLLGTCLLHAFVIGSEKEEYKNALERAIDREKHHHQELRSARELAYTDVLTGVKSKLAYVEEEEQKDLMIENDTVPGFAVVIFDLNGLKEINDKLGHEFGDRYIVSATQLINERFNNSSIFRIGGDEFAVFLEDEDYLNRNKLIEAFDMQIDENAENGGIVVAAGMSVYRKGQDTSVNQVFSRADRLMYIRKRELKKKTIAINEIIMKGGVEQHV